MTQPAPKPKPAPQPDEDDPPTQPDRPRPAARRQRLLAAVIGLCSVGCHGGPTAKDVQNATLGAGHKEELRACTKTAETWAEYCACEASVNRRYGLAADLGGPCPR